MACNATEVKLDVMEEDETDVFFGPLERHADCGTGPSLFDSDMADTKTRNIYLKHILETYTRYIHSIHTLDTYITLDTYTRIHLRGVCYK